MSIWKNKNQTPVEGSKIEVVLKGQKYPEVTVWVDGKPYHDYIKWELVRIWKYLDKHYMERMRND